MKMLSTPKKIHFVWIGSDTHPTKYIKFIDSFKEHNSDFEIKVWYEKDILELLESPNLIKYKERWKSLPLIIMKCDLSRSLILYAEGGLYVDMDFICYKNLSSLIEHKELILVREAQRNGNRMLNSTYGGSKGNSFFTTWLDFSFDRIKNKGPKPIDMDIFSYVTDTTGPDIFYKFVIDNNYEYDKDCCKVAPICENNNICKECQALGITKYYDGYNEILGNYMDTKWYEGTGYINDRSCLDIFTFVASRIKINVYLLILLFLILVIIIIYGIYKACTLPNNNSRLMNSMFLQSKSL